MSGTIPYSTTPFLFQTTSRLNQTARRNRNFLFQAMVNQDSLTIDLTQLYVQFDIASIIGSMVSGTAETILRSINSSTGIFQDRLGNISMFLDASLLNFGNIVFDYNTQIPFVDFQYRLIFMNNDYSNPTQIVGGGFRLFS